jgi:putative transposase
MYTRLRFRPLKIRLVRRLEKRIDATTLRKLPGRLERTPVARTFCLFPNGQNPFVLAARYAELNPVRATLVKKLQGHRWGSASAHIAGRDDRLVPVEPLFEMFGKWDEFLSRGLSEGEVEKARCHERAGRPLSADSFGCIPDFL